MDPNRFGRALGLGTRDVARALLRVADAAAAPNPAAKPQARARQEPAARPPASDRPREVLRTVQQAQAGSTRVFTAGRAAGKQALAPVSRAAGVLWFEITGVFFGIFAAGMGFEAWHRRADFVSKGDARLKAWLVLGLGLMFMWFTVSSFVSANRRNRR